MRQHVLLQYCAFTSVEKTYVTLPSVYLHREIDMGTVNGQSVREEAERIRAEFNRIAASKKIDSESKMLFQSMLINLLIAIFLEKTTKKNNKNSSKPSSQTEKDESATTNAGTNGKGKKENNVTADNTRTVETVSISKVTQCDVCGEDLTRVTCQHTERRTQIDMGAFPLLRRH
jgi:transposase